MKCPVDIVQLVPTEKNGLTVGLCPSCKGFLVSLHQPKAAALKQLIVQSFESSLMPRELWSLKSPTSSSVMKRFAIDGIELDYCEQGNAVWFDCGEYPRIAQKISELRNLGESGVAGQALQVDDSSDAFAFFQMFSDDNGSFTDLDSGGDFFADF